MHPKLPVTQPTAVADLPAPQAALSGADWLAYATDASQRAALVLDTMRQRGNAYREHREQGTPPLLKFEHELVLDGSTLPRPCNYALLRIVSGMDMPVNPLARAVIVVDPRAGHGPGIGGFKMDSEVGVAMRAGHPVYFITFRPEPEDGQTLADVMQAEVRFIEEVTSRHPQCAAKPVIIGNCQAGWAIAGLAALNPGVTGPLMLVGSPLSYWAGGAKLNPMRYSGGALGGAWLAALSADLGAGRFDGAHLVENFEKLNPAFAKWGKYYNLWSKVDTEAERFLEFERWWGGYFRMTGSEIETIVENLFVGNRLARGSIVVDGARLDLRNIEAPIVVFASWGDNITPPPQALNWIIDTWGDERAITAAGRTIVYVLHEDIGHLGIFVGANIAKKEHDQIVNSIDVIEQLPPGLYEMKLEPKAGLEDHRWEDLEHGAYSVQFQHRTMNDLRALNPEGREDERLFSTMAKVSEINTAAYKTFVRPWVRALVTKQMADALVALHPLRLQRQLLSDANPMAWWIKQWAGWARTDRRAIDADHPLRAAEGRASDAIAKQLDAFRDARDKSVRNWTRWFYGPQALGALLPPDPPDEEVALARADADLVHARRDALQKVGDGGFAAAVCRIVLAGMVSIGSFEGRSLHLARLLAQHGRPQGGTESRYTGALSSTEWSTLMRDQARITALAPVEALNALSDMIPDSASRENALALAAAVLMIEPTLANPRSEIIEYLIGTLGVDPMRVIELAKRMTESISPTWPQKATRSATIQSAAERSGKRATGGKRRKKAITAP
jgi:hypothetical protein